MMRKNYDPELAERAAALWQILSAYEGEDADAQLVIERHLRDYVKSKTSKAKPRRPNTP